ncbi:hypothetical protein SCLCIDRAFT_24604 [Scleroderma citrinum Foug A]|uniref:CxC2-like cysteine cluster KDZ transposase-associated domain-containing protein n=1 Tax=Scleroderma citrinum Foug A TaxID=1036808 RepID=A0A0C2ZN82_9AGAM|nr:hypothetical protein SCLCIDRAFT_24604 [Scleroderma citrinum Foug A]
MHFTRVTLKSLGLHLQFGHAVGDHCCNPKRAFGDEFVVIDTNGIHDVALDFCGCGTAQTHVKQLLHARLFPATIFDPKTAATFQVLEKYQVLSFESKASSYEYYQCLDRYLSFLRVIHEWRHLKMLKCAGRGHDPSGIVSTHEGQCALLCPTCPQPGKNLPTDWHCAAPEKRWLYAKFVALDANFHLHCKNVSSDQVDPGLSKGWSYFVEETSYKVFIEEHKYDTQEHSTCSGHNAVNMADSKKSHGLAMTGVIYRKARGRLTLRKLIEAMKASMEHDTELTELEACIKMPMITEWQREIDEWECDNLKCNLYEIRVTTITQASIGLELARAEASELQAGNDVSPHPEVSASTVISSGLELEEQQRLLKTDISSLGSHPTDNQLAKLQERTNALKQRIDNWQNVQPGEPAKVKEMKLFLPSEFCDRASCPNKLCEHEWKLHEAQAHEALRDLRHFLRLRTHLYKFKDTNVRGQVANTRA